MLDLHADQLSFTSRARWVCRASATALFSPISASYEGTGVVVTSKQGAS